MGISASAIYRDMGNGIDINTHIEQDGLISLLNLTYYVTFATQQPVPFFLTVGMGPSPLHFTGL